MIEYNKRVEDEERKCVSSNYFGDHCKEQTDEWLESGYWVGFCADCIGHTRAAMFENDGERYIRNKYGDEKVLVGKTGYGMRYFKLK